MKKALKYTTLCLTMLLVACSGDEPAATAEGCAARVSAAIGDSRSRASGSSWDAGDVIGVTGTGYANKQYVTADGRGAFSYDGDAANGIFFQTQQVHTFSAYYPFSGRDGTAQTEIAASTSDQSRRKEFDFLFASGATASSSSPEVNFTAAAAFHHCMSRLTFSITPDIESGIANLDGCKEVILGDIITEGKFDPATGIATANGVRNSISLTGVMQADGSGMSGEAVIFPQIRRSTISLTIGGNRYSCPLTVPARNYLGGTSYHYDLTVANTGLRVEGCTITDWIPNDKGEVAFVKQLDMAFYDGSPMAGEFILTGTTDKTIILADGAKATFQNLIAHNGVRCQGNAVIYLKGVSVVEHTLAVGPRGTTMTIDGDDSARLRAKNNGDSYDYASTESAAIGMTKDQPNGGRIVINGGNIEAVSNGEGSAIGSKFKDGRSYDETNRLLDAIIINGGEVYASAYYPRTSAIGGDVGRIEIKNGYVIARGETYGVGIGAASECTVDDISITGGWVQADGKGLESVGIGGCRYSTVKRLEISGGDIIAVGGEFAPAIGLKITLEEGIRIRIYGDSHINAIVRTGARVCIGVEQDYGHIPSSIEVTGGYLEIDRRVSPSTKYFNPVPNPYRPHYELEQYAPHT